MAYEELVKKQIAVRLLTVGTSSETVAKLLGMSPSTVRRLKAKYCKEKLKFPSQRPSGIEDAVEELFRKGYPLDKISALVGLTGERVVSILRRRGLLKI